MVKKTNIARWVNLRTWNSTVMSKKFFFSKFGPKWRHKMSQIGPKRWINNILYKQLNDTFKAFYITRNCKKGISRKANSMVMYIFGNYLNFWPQNDVTKELMATDNLMQKIKWAFQTIRNFKFCKKCILSKRNSLMISFLVVFKIFGRYDVMNNAKWVPGQR